MRQRGGSRGRWGLAVLASLLAATLVGWGTALASPQTDLQGADQDVTTALAALDRGDLAAAKAKYDAFDAAWLQVEDGVRDADRATYRAVEAAMLDVKVALRAEPVDPAAVRAALANLHATNIRFVDGGTESAAATSASNSTSSPRDTRSDNQRLQDLMVYLATARAAVGSGDAAGATAALGTFKDDWPAIEGAVRAKAPAVYTSTENDLAEAQAALASNPARMGDADATLVRMGERLGPVVEAGGSYGVVDAFAIMLREGLEALLIISALVVFLKRSGNADKERWIWSGAGAGVVLSLGLALVLQQVFSRAAAGFGSEMVEGVVGLAAAAMLFYMSYWLHSRAQLGAWERYIHDQSTAALARGSVLSLAFIALLAVFREGAETAVFYLGIAPSITVGELLLGVGLAVAALGACGLVVLALGQRLPLRPFFLVSSGLIYYLGFKFVGTGLHALQVADVLPTTPAPVPAVDFLGIFPSWETTLPQLALVLAGVAILVWTNRRAHAIHATAARAPSARAAA